MPVLNCYLDDIAEAGGDKEANDEALLDWGDINEVVVVVDVDAGNNGVAGVVELADACELASVVACDGEAEDRSAGVDRLNGVGDVAVVVVVAKGPEAGIPVWDMGMSRTILRGTWKKETTKLPNAFKN